jgi:hypothetical protein
MVLASAASVVVLMVGVACGGGDDQPADTTTMPGMTESATSEATSAAATSSSTPEAPAGSPTPAPTVKPATLSQEFRDFAPQIAEAVENEDFDFFVEHAWAEPVTCTEQDVEIQGFFAACKTVGEQFQGIGLSVWGLANGGLVPGDRVLNLIQSLWTTSLSEASDGFGDGKAHVYALGANPRDGYDAELAVITAIIKRPAGMEGTGPLRVAVVTHWRYEQDDWRMFEAMQSVEFTEDLLEPTENGRQYINDWEQYQP